MKYYNKIKQKLINIEITKKAKDYCKNKNGLIAYYNVQKKFSNEKISTVLAQFRHNITEYIKKIKKIKSDIC